MTLIAILLLLVSAFTHAAWNLIGKRRYPTSAFFLLANIVGAVCLTPVLLYKWRTLLLLPACVWCLLGGTAIFMALYYVALAGAYRAGDMSIAYPLARSSPVLVVTVVTLILGRGGQVSWQCVIGILLVVGGCFVLPMKRFGEWRIRNYLNATCLLALLAAVGTTGYSIIDDEALRRLRALSCAQLTAVDASVLYISLEAWACTIALGVFVMIRSVGRSDLLYVLRTGKKEATLTGVGIYLTYTLVLISMSFVSNVSYVVAFRQLSIPIGAVLGVIVFREPRHIPKFVGIGIMVIGLILVGTG